MLLRRRKRSFCETVGRPLDEQLQALLEELSSKTLREIVREAYRLVKDEDHFHECVRQAEEEGIPGIMCVFNYTHGLILAKKQELEKKVGAREIIRLLKDKRRINKLLDECERRAKR